jgi:hypothetical protein
MIAGENCISVPAPEFGETMLGVFMSKLYTFCLQQTRTSMHNEAIRNFPALDFSRPWSDKELYEHFDLSQEEIRYIGNNSMNQTATMMIKSKTRVKANGEVFTPMALVSEILDRLPVDNWRPEKTYIDPACGSGNFLVEIVARKIKFGSTPLQALQTAYGIDIMPDNVAECQERLLLVAGMPEGGSEIVRRRIVCADALSANLDELFGE